jgi:hypothetical protein
MEKRIQELKKKKAAGTISEQETKRLEQWEQRLKRWNQSGTPAKPAERPSEKPEKKPAGKP